MTHSQTSEDFARTLRDRGITISAVPLPPVPTITIPVAEYERLKKRARFWGAFTPEKWEEIADQVNSPFLRHDFHAAIKEQEG